MSKIKINSDLYKRATKHAEKAGYNSIEEFVTHIIDKEIERGREVGCDEKEVVEERLRGLGYIE